MATASETDVNGTSSWSRTSFSKSFKRKGRKNKGSETGSIASSGGGGPGDAASPQLEPSASRRNSNDSSRMLSIKLGNKKRSKTGLSRTGSESGGSEALSRATADEAAANEEDSSNYYTEEDEESSSIAKRPTLSARNSHLGHLASSSPLITTETLDPSPLSHVATAPVSSGAKSNSLQAPSPSQRRSPSPVGRLKEAFSRSRRNSTAPAAVPETAAAEDQEQKDSEETIRQDRGRAGTGSPGPVFFNEKELVQEPGEKTPSPIKTKTPRPLITKLPSTPPGFNGPSTVVTPPTPTDNPLARNSSTPSASVGVIKAPESAHTASPPPDSNGVRKQGLQHRRVKSAGQPSKLSNTITAPLTPAIEEVKTPGGTLTTPNVAGGFFSSMFSAAQSAANTLTNTITAGGGQKTKSDTDPKVGRTGGEEVILPPGSDQKQDPPAGERKPLAIETLGSGNLSLSHLGISENSDVSPMNSSAELVSSLRRDEAAARAEDESAARAVSMAYSEKTNGDRTHSATPSVVESTEHASTPVAAEHEGNSLRRAGSVRSRLSGRRRRTRGSSAATGNTMAPTISGPGSIMHKLPGFSVAPQKRQRDFHNLFRSVPEDDYLIEDYSAALQRDILLQGRMYISEGHICFSSNILGWVTNLVMSFDEIISVEKKATAMIFQNGIIIQTLQAKNTFASLLNRDTTYDLIISIWRITHPNLRSTLNGAPVEGPGSGDKTEKVGTPIEEESASEEVYDEDEEDEDDAEEEAHESFVEPNEGSTGMSEAGDTTKAAKRLSSNPAGTPVTNGLTKTVDAVESVLTGATATLDFPGPATHAPTSCGDNSSHLEKVLLEDSIPAPLGKVYSLMFGPASGRFMRKWLVEDQKSMDLQLDENALLDNEHKSMTFSYIKPLSGSIGPKQTKCIINQTLEQFDLNKAVTVACSTQNPDVPSGNIFVVKTRYCLSWGPNNSTKFLATCQIEWSGKSWLKGPIEKGANDGQLAYQKDIVAALKAAVVAKSTLKAGSKGKGKGSKRKKDSADITGDSSTPTTSEIITKPAEPNWGLFEPLRGPLSPVASMVHPSFVVAFLMFMVFFLWWRLSVAGTGAHVIGLPHAQRIIAYEEMWRHEESELWKWLENRAGLDGSVPSFLNGGENIERKKWLEKQRVKEMKRNLDGAPDLEEKQMKEAIRVTRERLQALEKAVLEREEYPEQKHVFS
ncbi:uncharacterized protein PV09_06510 [Verruconis gallopava]|uniref:VASt domain-containing protein n=1 Tax=Verruconis gallopava TaxID=253628 RepID=A0A0D2A5M9_9PEZI|nr:uncharacterized protein PV09_06510 [Verruconis gallopava]KIW02003.1 hypothetical protein PV09_06510 [Verruconis gallopava]